MRVALWSHAAAHTLASSLRSSSVGYFPSSSGSGLRRWVSTSRHVVSRGVGRWGTRVPMSTSHRVWCRPPSPEVFLIQPGVSPSASDSGVCPGGSGLPRHREPGATAVASRQVPYGLPVVLWVWCLTLRSLGRWSGVGCPAARCLGWCPRSEVFGWSSAGQVCPSGPRSRDRGRA